MRIDKLIEQLEKYKKEYGNLETVIEIDDFFSKNKIYSTIERFDVVDRDKNIRHESKSGEKGLLLDWRV